MTQAQAQRQPFTDSMFNMWRCVIAVGHADGVIHEKERELFEKVLHSVGATYQLSEEQRATFSHDLEHKQDVFTLLPGVTDAESRALLLFFAQIVASIDGTLAYDEATLVGRLHGKIGSSPDTRDRVAEIRRDIADQMSKRRADAGTAAAARNPIYYALDALLLRLGMQPVN